MVLDTAVPMESQGTGGGRQRHDNTMPEGRRTGHSRNLSSCSINTDVLLDAELRDALQTEGLRISRNSSLDLLDTELQNEELRRRLSRNVSRSGSVDLDEMKSQGKHDDTRQGLRIRHSRNVSRCSMRSFEWSTSPPRSFCEHTSDVIATSHPTRAGSNVRDLPSCPALSPDTAVAVLDAGDCIPHACEVETDSRVKESAGGKKKRSWCTWVSQFVIPGRARDMSLLMIITFFLCMDQSILAPNLSDIARDFNMTDIEKDTKLGGELSLSFFIVAAPASLITGHYADRVNRKNLFTAIILFGEVGCLICYWVEEYWQLLVLRLMTGIAVGGSGVLVASLIGDMYPPEERPRANMYAGIATNLGVGLGQVLAATTGSYIGWRLPFLLTAAPCLLVLIVFHYCAKEPTRGAQELRQYLWQVNQEEGAEVDGPAQKKETDDANRAHPPLTAGLRTSETQAAHAAVSDLTSDVSECHTRDIDARNKHQESLHRSSRNTRDVPQTAGRPPADQLTVQELHASDLNEFGVALVVDGLCVRHTRNISWCSISSICSAHLADEEDTTDALPSSHQPLHRTNSNVDTVPACPEKTGEKTRQHTPACVSNVGEAPSGPAARAADAVCDMPPAAQELQQSCSSGTSAGNASTRTCVANSVFGEFVHLCSVRSNVIIYAQGILECMPWGVINVFIADYLLVDRKAHSDFLTDKLAAWAVCGAFGLGSLAGSVIGGELGSRIYVWKKQKIAYLLGICQMLAIVPQVLVLNLPFQLETLVPINFIGGVLISVSRPNLRAIVLNVNAPNTRGTASAWFSIFGEISAGIGPPLVALLVVAYGRQMAFSLSFAMWFFNGLVVMLLRLTMVADEDRVVAQVVAEQMRARMDALGVEAQWAMNEANNFEASDKTLEMICVLERRDSRAICALDFRENEVKELDDSVRSTNSRTPLFSAV